MVLLNPFGEVNIRDCTFLSNGLKRLVPPYTSFAGGLHIEFSQYTLTTVVVENCTFIDNKSPKVNATDPTKFTNNQDWNGISLGGGMGIALLNTSEAITIHVINCMFMRNLASWGGGLCVYLQQQTVNNSIVVANSTFFKNTARQGGGGLQIRLGELDEDLRNQIHFQNVTFEENYAQYGGGTSVSALLVSQIPEPGEILQFINCKWYANSGHYSPAVDLSPYRSQPTSQGYLPIPLFKDICVQKNHEDIDTGYDSYTRVTQGVFIVTRFSVLFQGDIVFRENWYSALYLTSGRIIFDKNSNALFHGNHAIKGGAIAVHGFSALVVNDNSHFSFVNNSAIRVGGGIYYASSDQREYFEGESCFLEYGGNETNVTQRKIRFTFTDNKALLGGLSIYSESLYSCYFAYFEFYTASKRNVIEIFDRIGTFHFDTQRMNKAPVSTAARKVVLNKTSPIETLPGKVLSLPLVMLDEFSNTVYSEYALRVEDNEMVELDKYFTVNNKTCVYGAANQNATLVLSTPQPLYNIDYYVQVTLLPCPPGFYYNQDTKRCWCSADNKSHSYPAITKCDYVNFKAFIKSGYWVGYYPTNTHNADDLYTAFYPSTFKSSHTGLQEIAANNDNLSDFMCESSREGVLCGACKTGYSAYYHSREEVTCGDNKQCRLGILFYFLSEIVPTVIFFTIVIALGVSFSSGALNGFVFFSQVVDVFSQDLIFTQVYLDKTSSSINKLQMGSQLVYGVLNIDFFSVFPFCLWEGANIMDVLAFKYVTTIFALALIILIVIVINCSVNIRCKKMYKLKLLRKDSSVTHGITTFLIICYGQYTRVSFLILNRTYLQGKPGVKPIPVTYYGGLLYLQGEHLLYAIPAIAFTVVLVVLPPLCLILYPLVLHLLALCGLSEHPAVNKTLQLLYINHLMPLFDSFQSCYKDRMRFFAGIYFLYRVAALLAYMHSETLPPVFLAVLILGIHSVLQPYKSWKHNAIDALIFLDIAIINSITVMIKTSLTTGSDRNILQLKLVQLTFIYLPMLCLLFIVSLRIGRKLCSLRKSTRGIEEPTGASSNPTVSQVSQSEIKLPLLELS